MVVQTKLMIGEHHGNKDTRRVDRRIPQGCNGNVHPGRYHSQLQSESEVIKLDRSFGKCAVKGCSTRRVVDGGYINGVSIHYRGGNDDELRSIGCWCEVHNRWLTWNPLRAKRSDKECNGVCMGAVGPSCDCSCGGENHGKNHVA